MKKILVLMVLVIVIGTGTAQAKTTTAKQLVAWCGHNTLILKGMCIGYFQAYLESNFHPCIPKELKISVIRKMILGHLKSRPERRKGSASSAIKEAIESNWPCKNLKPVKGRI